MGVQQAIVAATSGDHDPFDRVVDLLEDLRGQVEAADILVEFHQGRTLMQTEAGETVVRPHLFDRKATMLEALEKAIADVREACNTWVTVMVDVP